MYELVYLYELFIMMGYLWKILFSFIRGRPLESRTGASVEGLLEQFGTLEKSYPGYFHRGMEILPVNHERREEFIDYTHLLYTATTMAVFQNTANMILKEFPGVKNWINWWTQPMNAAMIFRSHKVLQPELQDHRIRTSNGTESFHRDLYRVVQKKQSILDTLPHIFSYLKNDAANFERIDKGFQINYNTTPRKTSRRKRKTVNDGRAPDVTSKLLGKKRKIVKKLRNSDDDQKDSKIKERKQIKKRTKEVPNEDVTIEKKREEARNRRNTLAKKREIARNKVKKAAKAESRARLEKRKHQKKIVLVVQDSETEKLFHEISLLPRCPDELTSRLNIHSEAGVISGLYSPASDGNCGWRAAAYNLYGDESAWKKIKEGMEVKLLQEIDYFKTIFGSQEVYELMEILKLCGESSISFDNYFRFDSCSQLLAEVCNILVIVYSDTGFQDCTYLPFLSDPRGFNESDNLPDPCILYLKGNHILNVQFIFNNNWKRLSQISQNNRGYRRHILNTKNQNGKQNETIPEKNEKKVVKLADSAKVADIAEKSRISQTYFEHKKPKWELENEFIPEKDKDERQEV
ncbi:hypothetical protein BDC45DRAFT_582862 [Circinella umbellata]|nr:hypothetical protein BDC45DRAFT_582862 [Circinella umbellata]